MNNKIQIVDLKDKQILFELDMHARLPLTQLAKRVKLSPQTTKYRLEQLEKSGIIRGFVTLFDAAKFGCQYFRLFIRFESLIEGDEENIIAYFQQHSNVVWFVSTSGRWDMEVLLVARNFIHFNTILRAMYDKFPGKLHNNVTSVSIANFHHPRGYLIGKMEEILVSYGGEPEKIGLSRNDKRIIGIINQNARLPSTEIGARLGLNYKTVKLHRQAMEKKRVIQAYRTWIDFKKLGSMYHKALITLKAFPKSEELRVLEFCKLKPNVVYLVTCVWPWQLELEVESQSEETFLNILKEFRGFLGDNIRDYEILTVTEEHKLNYCPFSQQL